MIAPDAPTAPPGPSRRPSGAQDPQPQPEEKGEPAVPSVARDSFAVAGWTVVSRITGFVRVAVVAAVLGPTYLGNTFQATNLVPNLVYEFLTGSILASLLVPPLVRSIDRGDRRATADVAGGFLGVVTAGAALMAGLIVVGGPLLLRVFASGVADPAVAAAQRRTGMILLALLMPQVVLYCWAGVGGAVMNAHGRFGLAAAAPAFENFGVVLTMVFVAVRYGTKPELLTTSNQELVVLGIGTTAAVGLHAAAQWWGARRAGVTLVPKARWRDPEVQEAVRRIAPALGYSGLNALRIFAVLVVANRLSGGVVAFQLALAFFYLPVAVGARPVAVAMLPRFARLFHAEAYQELSDEIARGLRVVLFLSVPAAVVCTVLSYPLARAVSWGAMATGAGTSLVALSLAALGVGIVGEGLFVLSTNAAYARGDTRTPLRSMMVRTGVALSGMVVAYLVPTGRLVLVLLGLAVSLGNILSALHLRRATVQRLPRSRESALRPVPRLAASAAAMALVGWGVSAVVRQPQLSAVLAAALGLAAFLAVERLRRSPELDYLMDGLR